MPFSERKKNRVPGLVFSSGFFVRFFRLVFSSGFFVKKSSSKPINMGSSFEDLDARNPTAKAVRDLDTRFKTCRNLGKFE